MRVVGCVSFHHLVFFNVDWQRTLHKPFCFHWNAITMANIQPATVGSAAPRHSNCSTQVNYKDAIISYVSQYLCSYVSNRKVLIFWKHSIVGAQLVCTYSYLPNITGYLNTTLAGPHFAWSGLLEWRFIFYGNDWHPFIGSTRVQRNGHAASLQVHPLHLRKRGPLSRSWTSATSSGGPRLPAFNTTSSEGMLRFLRATVLRDKLRLVAGGAAV